MSSKFKIIIPKPCHEDWNKMTPTEKGRFCNSCAKTVVDFTKKSTEEIKDYLIENSQQKVCGHFYKKQLDTIIIEIPQITFHQQMSFKKLFILALLFVMGTTLFSCQYADGKKQKIENVIIKDSLKIIEEDVGLIFPDEKTVDSLKLNEEIVIDGWIEVGEVVIEEEIVMDFIIIEEPPRFQDSKNLSKQEAKEDFDVRIKDFILNNFDDNLTKNLGLKKINTKFILSF
ncbi:hypothetical protein JL193_08275 [Polaribacter batillariae]|uniref:Uncharacterized protein n=1 Tax=Polaribacter batillariae TaxID=2808900 RepID=A0ABX7T0F6_9FLAO|nr:hypothetical protein [Polaribacter batillariae]QTD39218.1 hypothetical protein JL193_08275 [Polaribacter batillariae]